MKRSKNTGQCPGTSRRNTLIPSIYIPYIPLYSAVRVQVYSIYLDSYSTVSWNLAHVIVQQHAAMSWFQCPQHKQIRSGCLGFLEGVFENHLRGTTATGHANIAQIKYV
jgi:hypothetical protein